MSLLARRDSKYSTPVNRLQNEVNQLFDSFFSSVPFPTTLDGQVRFVPSVSVSENKDNVIVRAEIPGMESKDLEINVEDDVLVLKGEKKSEKSEENDNYHYNEVNYGAFVRRIALPTRVDSERAEASLEKGVLRLKLPKVSVPAAKTIKVK